MLKNTLYREKDTDKVYTKWEIYTQWLKNNMDSEESFDEWLTNATDFSGVLEIIV